MAMAPSIAKVTSNPKLKVTTYIRLLMSPALLWSQVTTDTILLALLELLRSQLASVISIEAQCSAMIENNI